MLTVERTVSSVVDRLLDISDFRNMVSVQYAEGREFDPHTVHNFFPSAVVSQSLLCSLGRADAVSAPTKVRPSRDIRTERERTLWAALSADELPVRMYFCDSLAPRARSRLGRQRIRRPAWSICVAWGLSWLLGSALPVRATRHACMPVCTGEYPCTHNTFFLLVMTCDIPTSWRI